MRQIERRLVVVLGANGQLSGLSRYYDDSDSQSYPLRQPGIATAGQLVYRDLNCAACHTQQVRREDFGSDLARGWGERQSVARDYIYQPAVQLGHPFSQPGSNMKWVRISCSRPSNVRLAISKRRESFVEPALQGVLDEIDLRARVELAKLEQAERPLV